MTCRIKSNSSDLRIEWNKKRLEAETLLLTSKWNASKYYSNSSERMVHSFNETFSILTVSHVELNDTGQYVCQASIEIPPPVFTKSGNGTYLRVQVGFKDSISNDETIAGTVTWILSGLLSTIGLVISVYIFFLIKRLICPKKVDPTYVNVQFRNKAGQNNQLTEQGNVRYIASSRYGYPKTIASKLPHRLEGDLK
ncbi:uncharacterized protein LOC127582709 [Pristis pectinata]|uniref:uncharacterized protein LOC127582709 n=1 Tax=Pristis pectinata TaxID=685728 RepID=UPI00223D8653|nr:uncharacterized protein LOC127582709 [Pristis pectinata]